MFDISNIIAAAPGASTIRAAVQQALRHLPRPHRTPPCEKSAQEIVRDREHARREYEKALRKVRERDHLTRKPPAWGKL
jgi:hypothetical protein